VHPDLLFEQLPKLKEAGVKGVIGGSDSPKELPLGQRKQLEEIIVTLAFSQPCGYDRYGSNKFVFFIFHNSSHMFKIH
jgi:hypothetical protein